ncbi:MAG: type II toxin-antitoxin system RelE/ParE family toxin [Bryobacteraceae bacterium]|jgi:toxin ParE1/3/4
MQIVWTAKAVTHLTEIHQFIAADKPDAAARTAARILQAVELLGAHPHLGRSGRHPNTREIIVPGTPYLIPYRICAERLQILAVLHGARKRVRR